MSTNSLSRRSVYWCIAAATSAIALAIALLAALGNSGALHRDTLPDADGTPATAVPGTATRAQLAAHLAGDPRDGRSWVLLARLDFAEDRYPEAAQEYEKALAASAKVARDPDIWCEYADALGMTQGGSLEGRPRELIARALAIAPDHPKALEMAGSLAYEQGDYAGATRNWRQLLAQLPANSARHRELAAALARVEPQAAQDTGGPRAAADNRSPSK